MTHQHTPAIECHEDDGTTILIGSEKCPAIIAQGFELMAFAKPKYAVLIVKAVNRDHLFDEVVKNLQNVLDAYCGQMSDRYDFPNDPWEQRPNKTRDEAIAILANVKS